MNFVFIGASHFGARCLEVLSQLPDCRISGVITAPKNFAISYRPEGVTNVLHADIKSYAEELRLPCQMVAEGMKHPDLLAEVKSWQPDAFLVAGWYHMIPKSWRQLAPAYGLHASLLPDYSGGAPLVWAMINGEDRTGITLFQMDDGVDTGPILGQVSEPIFKTDTIATLYKRVEEHGLNLLREKLPSLARGDIEAKPQAALGRRVMPQRSPEDGLINWHESGDFVDRYVRAQTKPYPGAFSTFKGQKFTIWKAHEVAISLAHLKAGTVFHVKGVCCVACGNGALALDEIQIQEDTLFGDDIPHRFVAGEVLGRDYS